MNGRALGDHIAESMAPIPFAWRLAVVSETPLNYLERGYALVVNDAVELGLSHSIRLGVEAARGASPEAILIALADMPRVSTAHVERLFAAQYGPDTIVSSADSGVAKPPALFGSDLFDRLLRLEGDRGARVFLQSGISVSAPVGTLIDIDRQADLAALA